MKNLNDIIKSLGLPKLRSKEEMKKIMQSEMYGYLPSVSATVSTDEPKLIEGRFDCDRVHHTYVTLTVTTERGSHSFRVDRLLHRDGNKRPLVLLNNIQRMTESPYFPREELSELDVDFLVFCYKDLSSDDGDFTNGLAKLLLPFGQRNDTDCGKIGIWAWGAMRVLDYGLTLPGTDPENIAVVGHSRLGKTALYTAMMDERFKFALPNASGCCGDALAHKLPEDENSHKIERYSNIYKVFPYWFAKSFAKYATKANYTNEFDQHYLIASIAPRYVMVGACELDTWADPKSQQLAALAASYAWEEMGLSGFVNGEHYAEPGESFDDGHVGYFMIHSNHFLSRHCWHRFIRFIEKHK